MGANLSGGNYIVDSVTLLHNSASSIAASAYGLVDGSINTIDTGSSTDVYRGELIIDVSAILTTAGNGVTFILQGANTSFSTDIVNLATLPLGDVTLLTLQTADSVTGRYIVPFTNEVPLGTVKRYLRLYMLVVASGTCTYTAFLSKAKAL